MNRGINPNIVSGIVDNVDVSAGVVIIAGQPNKFLSIKTIVIGTESTAKLSVQDTNGNTLLPQFPFNTGGGMAPHEFEPKSYKAAVGTGLRIHSNAVDLVSAAMEAYVTND